MRVPERFKRRSTLALLCVGAACVAAVAIALTLPQCLDDDPEPLAGASPTAEHGALSEGWSAVDVELPEATFELRPLTFSDAGVAPDSEFELTSLVGDIDAIDVPAMLRVQPEAQFTARQDSPRRVHLRAAQPLRRETNYRFTVVDPQDQQALGTWAFQTESPLRIVQSLPADRATGVPAATGIELTFSHDGVTGLEDRFHIDPPVEGRFEMHKRVAVFVPKKLEYRTLYTVTVDPGASVGDDGLAMEEPFSFSFETGSLDTRDDQNFAFPLTFARLVNEAGTAETPVLQLLGVSDPQAEVDFDVLRYADEGAFAEAMMAAQEVPQWSFWGRRSFRLDAAGLTPAATFRVKPVMQQQVNYGAATLAIFPDALPAGFYLVQAKDAQTMGQTLLQVTDVAAYARVSETRTLVWVNDLATGAALTGGDVRDQHGHEFSTGGDGVAFFDTPSELLRDGDQVASLYSYYGRPPGAPGYLTVHDGDRAAVVPLSDASPIGFAGYRGEYYGAYGYYGYYGGSEDHWSYVYTDRQLYRKTDDVRVWGIARRRDGGGSERLTIQLTSGGGYYNYQYQPVVIAETTAQTNDLGAFEATLTLADAGQGYYTLQVLSGDQVVTTGYVRVENFVKPAYTISVTPSRPALIAGEAASFEIAAQFFDGSPVPFVDLVYGGDAAPAGETPIKTDAAGKATVSYIAGGLITEGLNSRSFYVRPTGPEEGEINGHAIVFVLPATVMFGEVEGRVDGAGGVVAGAVHNVDLTAFDQLEGQYPDYNGYLGDAAPNRTVTARITQVTYQRVETGEIYDFIAKLTRKQYRYDTIETDRGEVRALTADDGRFELRFPAAPDGSYRVSLTAPDDAGRTTQTAAWVSASTLRYDAFSDPYLSISETAVTDSRFGAYRPPERYSDDEPVDVTVRRGIDPGEEGAGVSYLFERSRSGLREYTVQRSSRFEFAFSASDAPNVIVGSVQFDGLGYEEAYGEYNAAFDYDDARLDVSVTADRERYEPGDDVTLSIETRRDGSGVPADVALSVVDEAIFAVQGETYEPDIAETLYRPVSSGTVARYVPSFATYDPFAGIVPGGRGGDGGGGAVAAPDTGEDPRKDFRDVALFRTVRTDGDGRASVTFKLPDNITSWRVTSRAVSGDLMAGAGKMQVPVGLPFFVDATIAADYLAADRPTIALRAFGLSLQQGDDVVYVLRMPSLVSDPVSARGRAFERVEVTLPQLKEGLHELTIEAMSGELADAIVRDMRVVPSRLLRGDSRFYELAPSVQLEGSPEGRTRVVFSDHNRGRYYGDLLQLGWTWGDRVDQMLARDLAQDLLRTYFEVEDAGPPAEFTPTLYQTADGGVALFPYADDELILSARIASVAGARFASDRLAAYFQSVADNAAETRERTIIALFGLAATGAPVRSSLDRLAGESGLSVRERLYLGLAALAAGDETLARTQYIEVMQRYGEQRDPFVRVRTGTDQDDILEATSLAADLAAGVGDASAPGLYAYTTQNYTTDMLIELERLSYLSRALPRLPSEPVRFSYVLDGARKEASLEAGASLAVSVTPDELRELDPQPIEGGVGVATYFETAFDPSTVTVDADISVSRTITDGDIRQGDIVLVRLDYEIGPQALDGCYEISDLAPSGLRPVSRTLQAWEVEQGYFGDSLYPYSIEGQRVSFCAWRQTDKYRPATYWARVVTAGEYAQEPAIIQSQSASGSFNFAPGSPISIR